jgi:sterol desaturase/sphingolipid hydroxylase (fatty acid hydroxylase superfamily)
MDAWLDLLTTHLARPWWALVTAFLPWMLLVFVLERACAARPHDARGAWLNLRFIATALVINVLLVEGLGRAWLTPAADLLRPALAPVRDLLARPPVWVQFLLHVAVIDFLYYWTHRAQHRFALLWRLHELHHSDPSFNVTTTLRVHWLEELMKLVTVLLPAALLVDAPAGVPTLLVWAGAMWLFFIHANARIGFGPLDRVLVSPAVHRVHHSTEPAHHDRNFAAYFSFWDVLFGTYHAPPRGRWPAVGTAEPPPASALAAHLRPFRRTGH